MQNSTVLNTQSVLSFVQAKGFKAIAPAIRTNTNGYPYLTFYKEANTSEGAENIYFSKNGSATVGAGIPVTKELLTKFQIADTKNAAGETRTKLVTNAERIDVLELLS